MEYSIEVTNVTKVYKLYNKPIDRLLELINPFKKSYCRDFYATENISFSIPKGECWAILGKNGSGKSTLLKMITGVLKQTEGEIKVDGKLAALLELGAGFNMEYTGIENIDLSMAIYDYDKIAADEKKEKIIEFADIGNFINQPVKTYSSGMFARLAFAVAINVDPDILIIDEALSVGDIFFQQKCNIYMKEKMEGTTRILVSHDMNAVTAMANKVIVMENGKIIFIGNTLDGIEMYTKIMHSEVFAVTNKDEDIKDSSSALDEINIEEEHLGGAKEFIIRSYKFLVNGESYKGFIEAGDKLSLSFNIYASRPSKNLIFGYLCNDKFGNSIIGENTITSIKTPIEISSTGDYKCQMELIWPEVKPQHYFITLGIGEGHHEFQHTIQCWLQNVINIEAISPRKTIHALINNPITSFDIKKI
ncbi:ABC transporter ATP-binding protein [Lacrimispora xylanolytica]|uniref:ABC transporter ATP-binding protein n=1 Tax=Lacrimispora xylanolytica TaxID=29375 RepID=A0ABY7ACW8_9FIRM|nr:ABC transporter ATP-binding protein [Lacrimispora xylanolytica]WAJ24549.1 ABC transporter ATP-binding protein [Lacrimispora xylanolytica]